MDKLLRELPQGLKNGILIVVFWALTVIGSQALRYTYDRVFHSENAQMQQTVVTNTDGTVNVNGALLNKFMAAYERQVEVQSRQAQVQESIAALLQEQNLLTQSNREILIQHEATTVATRKVLEKLLSQKNLVAIQP